MTKLYRSNLGRGLFVLACALLAACQAAFGDYKAGQASVGGTFGVGGISGIGGSSNGGHSASGGATTASACDSVGAFRCTGTALEVCDNQQWQSLASCSSDLCDSVNGRCNTCAPGSHRCAAFNLQTCSSTGDSWSTSKACDTAYYCDSASNTCLTCLPGETFCATELPCANAIPGRTAGISRSATVQTCATRLPGHASFVQVRTTSTAMAPV